MKKILSLMLIVILSISIVGCNKGKVEDTKEVNQTNETKERFSMSEKGNCKFYITTSETLTSENGAIPYIYLEDEDTLMQIGYDARGFDSSKLTYIYVDGKLVSKESMCEQFQSSIDLQKDIIKYGKHKVEVIQYKNSESDNKDDVEVYKIAQYVVTKYDSEFQKGNEECKKQMKLKSDDKEIKEDKKDLENTQKENVTKDDQSDNSNKTIKKSSSSKSNTSSRKSHNKHKQKHTEESNSNIKHDDDGVYLICPNCNKLVRTDHTCPICGANVNEGIPDDYEDINEGDMTNGDEE